MSKFHEATDNIQEVVDSVVNTSTIPNWVRIKVLSTLKGNDIIKVVKANDIVEFVSQVDIIVIVREDAFERLVDEQQRLLVEEALTAVYVDEKENLKLEKPDFSTFSGMLNIHGADKMIQLKESVKSVFDQIKQEAEEAKQVTE
jgi:hypothetical protein